MITGKRCKAHDLYAKRSENSIKYALSKILASPIAPYVKHVFLYGSCIRKEQKYASDVDLFMVLDDAFDISKHIADVIFLKGEVIPLDDDLPEVDLKVVIGDSWKENQMLYYQNVKKEGVDIWNGSKTI